MELELDRPRCCRRFKRFITSSSDLAIGVSRTGDASLSLSLSLRLNPTSFPCTRRAGHSLPSIGALPLHHPTTSCFLTLGHSAKTPVVELGPRIWDEPFSPALLRITYSVYRIIKFFPLPPFSFLFLSFFFFSVVVLSRPLGDLSLLLSWRGGSAYFFHLASNN